MKQWNSNTTLSSLMLSALRFAGRKMKDNHTKKHELITERLGKIFSALYQGKIIDKNWLCEKFEVTERTAYRDLARLSPFLDEISAGRYRLSEHLLPSLHNGHLADFAKFAGVAQLFPHSDGPSLKKRLKNSSTIKIQGASSRENSVFSDLIARIEQAINSGSEVTYIYRNKPRIIHPYRLINQYGLWYLAGVDNGCLKAFELARIENFGLSGRSFTPEKDVVEELEGSSDIRFGKGFEATLKVSAHAAPYVIRRPLFPEQQIMQRHQDGGLTLSTAVRDKHTLFRWLRYWLPDISILAPAPLKAAFNDDLRRRLAQAQAENLPESEAT